MGGKIDFFYQITTESYTMSASVPTISERIIARKQKQLGLSFHQALQSMTNSFSDSSHDNQVKKSTSLVEKANGENIWFDERRLTISYYGIPIQLGWPEIKVGIYLRTVIDDEPHYYMVRTNTCNRFAVPRVYIDDTDIAFLPDGSVDSNRTHQNTVSRCLLEEANIKVHPTNISLSMCNTWGRVKYFVFDVPTEIIHSIVPRKSTIHKYAWIGESVFCNFSQSELLILIHRSNLIAMGIINPTDEEKVYEWACQTMKEALRKKKSISV